MDTALQDRIAGSKALRTRETQKLRAKAPLAAQFEDCAQAVKQLHAALNANPSISEQAPLRILVERCLRRLTSWGHDTGATSRVLDHSLRRASKPRTSTLRLLKEFHELVIQATDALPTAFEGPTGFGERPKGEQADNPASSSVVSPPSQIETQEIIDILGLGDQAVGASPEKHIAEAEEILDDLSDLRPTLLDPYDDDDPEPLVDADDRSAEDREYCQKAFSGASPSLVDRFVAANRRRRQNIHALRNDASRAGEMKVVSAAGTTGKAVKISSFQTMPSIPPSNRIRGYRKSSRPSTSAVVLSKTAPSTASKTTLFSSDARDEKASVTSLGSASVVAVPELRPPGPPVDVTNPKTLPFTCQYCCFEVPLELDRTNMDLKDWASHFYLDLQPYLCTFEGCGRAHKLFGVKQEWVQHELDYHRTQQTWYCANAGCDAEFATRAVFEQHLRSQHGDMVATKSPNFVDILIDTHQRVSLKPGLDSEQECALCGASYKDASTGWKDHIAHHLEQFALLAMGEDKESNASEDEPDRIGLTEEYADEMRVMYAPKPASALNDGAVIPRSLSPLDSSGLRDFTDDSGGNSGGEKRHRDESERMWAAKVETYLTKQPEEDGPNKPETEATETAWLNVPMRNHGFIGRNDDLRRLNEYISQPGHICVLSGRGGIGKTATAVEYARRFEQHYSSVIWIEAETTGGLADKYTSIGGNLFALGTESGQDPVSFTMAVRGKLERWDQRWLLIFDNVETWKDISRYIPRNLPKTKGSILITTRQQSLIRAETRAMQRVLHRIELVPLTPDEGARFLLCSTDPKVTPDAVPRHPEYRLAVQVAELVERLPLALIMIAGYVKESRASLDDFVEIWEEKVAFRSKQPKRSRLIVEGALDSSIDLLWDIGISELSVPARNLLEILAFLDPENIQKDLLVQDHSEEYLEFLNATETTLYKRMIRLLSGRKLIDIRTGIDGGESYKIHRLLQQKIVLDIGAQLKFDSAMRKATRLVRKRFPEAPAIQAPAPQNWKMCKEYMPHVFSLLRAYKDAQENFPKFKRSNKLAGLFYDAGFYIWDHQATGHDGLAFLDAAEDILDKRGVDEMAERRADIHCISGLLRNAMGCQQRVESLRRLKQALHIRKHIYDAQMDTYSRTRDVLLQNAATDYGILLLNRYDFLEAEEIFESCLRRYRVWGTEEEIPFEYSKYYYNMGIVRMWQEKLDESIQFLQHSVDLVEAAFGKEGQYWDNYFMLACFIRQAGDMQTSLDMHLEILKAKLDQVGKHSKSTILSTYAVGVMYANIGDLPTAIDSMERCLELATTSDWTEEAVGRAQYGLARLYRRHGVNLVEAEELEAKSRCTLEKYSEYTSDWIAGVGDQIVMYDDLQPTDEGRFTGSLLLQLLWARRRGETSGKFIDSWGREVILATGVE